MANVARLVPARSGELLTECQKMASDRLPGSLKTVLDKVDDALFELANKSDTSQRQNLYFDAMRELRLKRDALEANFISSFNREFENSIDLGKAIAKKSRFAAEPELSLVDDDEVEESLALTNFVDSMSSKCKDQLFGLDRRMGYLLSQPDLNSRDNPVGPQAIGTAFRSACQQLESDIEIKLTLFKIFDKFAGSGIHQMYRDINEHLVRRDVLPKIVATNQSGGPRGKRTRVIIESEDDHIEATGPDVFSTLQNLMRGSAFGAAGPGSQSGIAGASQLGGAGGSPNSGGMGGLTANATATLVDTLTLLQHGDLSGLENEIANALDRAQFHAGNVNVLRAIRETGAIGPVSQTDGLTLDIVSILFDYILDDPTIPDTMKALIGRLQIPMLKVALLDKALFSKKSHPARRFLDKLAAAAIGWTESSKSSDGLYDVMEKLVRRVVEEFVDDIVLIETALSELEAYLEAEQHEAEKRAAESTRSLRTREQIVLAKMEVDDAINGRLAGLEIREFVRQFLVDYWRQLMIITHVEHGTDSEIWTEQLQTVEELVWSIQEKSSAEERKAMTQQLPRLLKSIKRGMATLEMDAPTCSKFLSMLASVHVVSVKHTEEAGLAERHLFNDAHKDEPLIAPEDAESNERRIREGFAKLFERKGIDTEQLDIDLSLFDDAETEPMDEPEHLSPNIMQYVERVTELNLGDWVEFDDEHGSTMRARFTWISPTTGRYLFTMRRGEKALDTTLTRLADQFARGVARLVETKPDPIFDRAIGDLMDKLERETPGS